jgi:hypothetical protein
MIEIVNYHGQLWYRSQWIEVNILGQKTGWNPWQKVKEVKALDGRIDGEPIGGRGPEVEEPPA